MLLVCEVCTLLSAYFNELTLEPCGSSFYSFLSALLIPIFLKNTFSMQVTSQLEQKRLLLQNDLSRLCSTLFLFYSLIHDVFWLLIIMHWNGRLTNSIISWYTSIISISRGWHMFKWDDNTVSSLKWKLFRHKCSRNNNATRFGRLVYNNDRGVPTIGFFIMRITIARNGQNSLLMC